MALGLGASLGKTGVVTPGIVTDNLVMKHMYPAGAVQPLSDGACYFDASNSGVYLSDPFNYQTLTVSAWVYRIDDGNSHVIFGARDNSTDGFLFFISDDEYVRAKVNSTTSDEVAGTLITANTWNHVVATVTDKSLIQVYVNGAFGDDKALSGSIANTTNARIGLNNYDTSSDYKGYICNVGYWNRVLTQAEIKSIMWKQYADLSTTEKTSLVSWWNLDEAYESSSFVLDSHHGGGNTLGSNLITYNPGFESGSSSLTGDDDTGWDNNNIDGDDVSEVNTNSLYVKTGSNSWHIQEVGGASPTGIRQNCTITANTVIKVTAEVYVISGKATIDCRKGSSASTPFISAVQNTTTGQWETLTQIFDSGSETALSARLVTKDSIESAFYVDNISVQQLNGNTGTLS